MANFQEQIIFVRRSARLSNIRQPNMDNEEYETIDLTLDVDSEDEQANGVQVEGENVDSGLENMEVNTNKKTENLGRRRLESGKVENMDHDLKADKETEQDPSLKIDNGNKKNEPKRDKGTEKMEHGIAGSGKGKRAAGKRKIGPEAGKGKQTAYKGDIGKFKVGKDGAVVDGQSSDDDFVPKQEAKIPKVNVNTENPFTTKGPEHKGKVVSENKKGKNIAGPKLGRIVSRVHLRNPPGKLFRVITELSDNQKKDIISMGFGDFLEFKINDVPTQLAYWLLEQFDADKCILDVNGKIISITPALVKNMLGVPMGDIHIETRDNSDYRNPLIKQWKGQFGKDVTKIYNTHVADEILKTKRGGWLFKLNFLVLLFSTIGEVNLSNTVNLRFLPCIKHEDNIPNMDWCTYIIECLVRTKKSWNRNAHFNGPIILLLVVYATLDTPIKHWSSEALHKLEADMFQKTSVGDVASDDMDVVEEIYAEGLDNDIGWEDDAFEDGIGDGVPEEDVFAEDGGDDVPEDAEAMKRKASRILKRAGELLEMADKVVDRGIEDNPEDHGFLELKELRNELFVPRKYCNEAEGADEEAFTPETGVNRDSNGAANEYVFPFTQVYGTPTEAIAISDKVCREWERNHQQIPTRLNFEDDDIDLNVTQPPATQGKVVMDDLKADQELLDSLREYVSQDPEGGSVFTTPEQPISGHANVSNTSNRLSRFGRESMSSQGKEIIPVYPDPMPLNDWASHILRARVQRQRLLPEVLRSPYMIREVSLLYRLETHEKKVAECFFSGRLQETDVVFKTPFVDGERVVLESLFPGVHIASGAIDMFTHVLNHSEKHRSKMTVTRLFCHTAMLTSDMVSWEYHKALDKFVENMDDVIRTSEYKTIDGVQMVFFPIIEGRHFFVVCMNMKVGEVQLFDNILRPNVTEDERFDWFMLKLISLFEDYLLYKNSPYYDRMSLSDRKVMELGCMTTNNFVDCGVFAMRHMETYKGDGADLCRLSKEGKKQIKELKELRIKYAVKILLSDCNLVKSEIDKEVHLFRNVPVVEKKRLREVAPESIKLRVSSKLDVTRPSV